MLFGYVDIAPVSRTPRTNESFTITCVTNGSESLTWLKDGVFLSSCPTESPECFPPKMDSYLFLSNVGSKTFDLTITSVSLQSCGRYTCSDKSERNKDSVTLTVVQFENDSISPITEPDLGSDGNITILTDCVFPTSVYSQWSIVRDGEEIDNIKTSTSSTEECLESCSGSPAIKFKTSVFHQEHDGESIAVGYKLVIKIKDVDEPMTWTSQQRYKIRDTTITTNGSANDKKFTDGEIAGIVIGVLLGVVLIVVIIIAVIFKLRN
ncbi:hypothetical protein MAR_021798 [Mya arenaria]|uniref:Ig-like domain-containing protein n=1 Tax=Mya arenaria TaxID=6604 RepID=A0ABY7EBD2_MYAAR|nr:hypothetical protein MAR_021798 [Mya arenaria]